MSASRQLSQLSPFTAPPSTLPNPEPANMVRSNTFDSIQYRYWERGLGFMGSECGKSELGNWSTEDR